MNDTSSAPLNIATWVPCTQAEGPGIRFALWVQGCPLRCPGCCNPEMFSSSSHDPFQIDALFALILEAKQAHQIEGVTFLGGEPFAQALGLSKLASLCHEEQLSVMVFSGYTLDELKTQGEATELFLEQIDVLVDGRYEKSLHTENRRWIGSTNQRIHFLTSRYEADEASWKQSNSIDIHFDGKEIFITGFPEGPWKEQLEKWNARQRKAKKDK